MTFQKLYQMALRRAGDTQYFVTGQVSIFSHDIQPIKDEVQAAYEHAVNLLAMQRFYAVVNDDNVTYAVAVKEKDLRASGVLVKVPRKILGLALYPDADTGQLPTPIFLPWRGAISRRARWTNDIPGFGIGTSGAFPRMYLRGYLLGFYTAPTATQVVRVTSAPVVETLSADGDVPAQVPEEHHQYIAQRAAVMLLGGENSAPRVTIETLYRLEEALETVAPNINEYSPVVIGTWKETT